MMASTNGHGATEHGAENADRETERLALQRKRSIAIAVSLALLVVLFYVATLVKMGGSGRTGQDAHSVRKGSKAMTTERDHNPTDSKAARDNARVATRAALFACFMLGMAFASVPLYQMFCQVTGFAGTPQRAAKAPSSVLERTVAIRFDANTSSGLAWKFKPVQTKLDVKFGANTLAFLPRNQHVRQTDHRHSDVQCRARSGRRLLQQD